MSNTLLTLLSGEQRGAFYAGGYWRNDTLYAVVRHHAETTPDKIAVRERSRAATYHELMEAADRLAAALHERGVRQGQRVAVWLPSRIETAVTALACSRAGLVCCPSLHRDHTVGDVVGLLRRMDATALVAQAGYGADAERRDVFRDAVEQLPTLRMVLRLDALGPDTAREGVLAELALPSRLPPVHADVDTVVYLAFTSGTTGDPKGVMHSDNTLLAPIRALAADWSIDDRSVVYSLSPSSHNLGFGAMLLALANGGELVVHDLARGSSLADRLEHTGATFAVGVPTHAIDLLSELTDGPSRQLPMLRGFRISGASMPPAVAQGLLDLGIVPQSGYGMTEAGSCHYTLPTDGPDDIVATSGRACAGAEARVFDRQDRDTAVPAGTVGQIGIRGASLMLGYFGDQAATESSFNQDGWFLTGDLGAIDDEGRLRVTGRTKDVIIRGGHNIFPSHIENLATTHSGVDRAAAIPVADARLGEKVCLVLEPRLGHHVDIREMLERLDDLGLSRYDMPEYVLVVDELPVTPSGKIAKRRLIEWVQEGRVQPSPIRFRPRA